LAGFAGFESRLFLASSVTAPFEAKTWPGLVNRAEEDFSGRHLFFRMRVNSRLVGLLWKNVE
jgi:hypothetical protein